MTCPSCGSEVPDWAQQCPACGAELPRSGADRPADPYGAAPGPSWSSSAPGQSAGWEAPGGWAPPSPTAYGTETALPLAGWWYRVGATLVDGIVLSIVGVIVAAVFGRYASVISLIIGFAYQGWFLSRPGGATPGMMAVGTRVVDAGTGGTISFWRGVGRYAMEGLLVILFVVPWILDVLWPLWDANNQTLHDKVVNTLVVRTR